MGKSASSLGRANGPAPVAPPPNAGARHTPLYDGNMPARAPAAPPRAALPLAGKTALVTGGAQRIGRAIALELAAAGADVAFTWLTSQAAAARTLREIEQRGARGLALRMDVTRPAQIRRVFARLTRAWGRLDVLVNNAGIYEASGFAQLPLADWRRMLEVNLTGPFLVSQAALPLLQRARPGRIIHLTSLGATQAFPHHAHYCAAKAGLDHLTRVMAKALAPGIQVNAVAPGMIAGDRAPAAWERKLARTTPMRRPGHAAEVARAVLFFATGPEFITGQSLLVDGGLILA